MAAESGRAANPVARDLFEEPESFAFHQAVRLLGRMWPDRRSVGGDADPAEEVVRFVSDVSFSFPTSDLAGLEAPGEAGGQARMKVAFMGAATPNSVGSLPLTYAEDILDLERQRNFALRAFLDLFNHRFVSLFYRAWEKQRPGVSYERGESGTLERVLFALAGMGTEGLRGRLPFRDHALLSRAGLLARRPASACAIERVVRGYFGVPVRVEQFQARWYPIGASDQNRLGEANSRLGTDLFAGEEVLLGQFAFRLRIGPLAWEAYQDFLPSGGAFAPLRELVRLATSEEFDFEIQLVLQREEAPECALGGERVRLGWTTWIVSGERDRDPDDVVLSSDTVPPPTGPAEARPSNPEAMA